MERLYEFTGALGASVIAATHSRYVIDLNRPRDDASLYPGQDTTGLCPVDTFHREPLYRWAAAGRRRDSTPHRRVLGALPRGPAAASSTACASCTAASMLWDAHSICSVLPRFFEGRLPDLNFGSAGGTACDQSLAQRVLQIARSHPRYTSVLDGRFKGGYITRRYGRPHEGVHAIQLELAQVTYMSEEYPYSFDESRAATLRPVLMEMLDAVLQTSLEL